MFRLNDKMFLTSALLVGLALVGVAQVQVTDSQQQLVENQPATSRWPLEIPTDDGQILVFQPQLENFQGNLLKGRAAVSITTSKQQDPIFGAVWLESQVDTDRVARTVQVQDVRVTQIRIPGLEDQSTQALGDTIGRAMTAQQATLSLDQLLTMVETVQKENDEATDIQNNPPAIIFRDHAAIKVQYDGQPKLTEVANSNLMRVANTPFFVVLDPQSRTYFLKGAGLWFSAPDPMGPFQNTTRVPQAIAALADASDYKDPQEPMAADKVAGLEIITATEPTELIWTDGPPQMATIPNVGLLYMANTDSDAFVQIDTQRQYVLLSGRWFTAQNRNGPWAYVPSDQLPDDFRRIPPNSEQGDVLAHVPGTQAAADAVADAEIPQTAGIDRQKFDQPVVEYDGEPRFEAVQNLPLSYAVNTPTPVVQVENRYYVCNDAVWYLSASARGPWDICTTVPMVIYQLPPSCPIYPVRYCHVYGFTPDIVYVGYTPGYVGCYTYRGAVVYGTGYRYQPWSGRAYYARPSTFGFAAHYNSYVGHWGFSFGLASGSSGGIWIGAGERAWGRREPWFGYGGYRPVIVHRDVHEDIFRANYISRVRNDRNNQNDHNGRNAVVVNDRNRPVQQQATQDRFARNVYDRRQDVRREVVRTAPVVSRGRASTPNPTPTPTPRPAAAQPTVRREEPRNNVFADQQGNVYRKTDNGWEVRDKQQWKPGSLNEPRNDNPPGRIAVPARQEQPNAGRGGRAVSPAPDEPVVVPARGNRAAAPARGTAEPVVRPAPQPAPRPAPQPVDRGGREAQPPARVQAQPARDEGNSQDAPPALNREAKAREAGETRLRNYEKPAAAAEPKRGSPPPQPAPRQAQQQNRGQDQSQNQDQNRGRGR